MTAKAARKNKNNREPSQPTGLPDLAWYRDASDRRKRNAHIKKLCGQIAREFNPEKIILFGSQAYGKPTAESDIDLLVVMPYKGSPFRQAGEILKRLQVWMPVDLIIRSEKEIEQRLKIGDEFMREILEHGKVMCQLTPSKPAAVDGACSSKFRIHARKGSLSRTDCFGPVDYRIRANPVRPISFRHIAESDSVRYLACRLPSNFRDFTW
jgi:predicted nucleotidyltransferase